MAKKNKPVVEGGNHQSSIVFRERKFPFTPKQVDILKKLLDPNMKVTFLSGVAGSSKTYLSVYAALHLFSRGACDKIIYVRSVIESASRSLGFLPGTSEDKFSPFMMPLLEKGEELLSPDSLHFLLEHKKIECIPVNFLRGASWKDKIVIIDEAQNLTHKELTTLLTRIGENTKVFVLGDTSQSDINGKSGLADFIRVFDSEDCAAMGIYSFTFTKQDIVRSEILKFIVEKIEKIVIPKTH